MPGLIPEEVVSEIRERTDIVQVIGQYVQLKRSGVNHTGLCPFHDEKTPSFNVNSQKQFYHCFGCRESGDVFSFLMKIEGRRFVEVVEDLAARASVEIPREKLTPDQARRAARQRSEKQQGLDLNQKVAELYVSLLHQQIGADAQSYLKQRDISEAMVERFRLGFAPSSGMAVTRLVEKEGIPMELAMRFGLVAKRQQERGHHDRFWNRLIFPVIGIRGEVLGFGGRMLGEGDGPKYINTPETNLYRKGEVLYGISGAAAAMRKCNQTLLVEGNVDVVMMHQHGFENCVAPMGTALTTRQILLLKRFGEEVVAILDGDKAGQAAAMKMVPMLVESGLQTKIVTLPSGHDPDSFIRDKGPDELKKHISSAPPAVDFFMDTLRDQMEDSTPGRGRFLDRVAPVIALLPNRVVRDMYVDKLALSLQVDRGIVQRAVGGKTIGAQGIAPRPQQKSQAQPLAAAELAILGILVQHPHLFPRAESADVTSLLTNNGLRDTYRAAMQIQRVSGRVDLPELLNNTPEDVHDAVAKVVTSDEYSSEADPDSDPTRMLDDCVARLRKEQLEVELEAIKNQMGAANKAGDMETWRTLAARQQELTKNMRSINLGS